MEVIIIIDNGVVQAPTLIDSEHYAGAEICSVLSKRGFECPLEWEDWDDFGTYSDGIIADLHNRMEEINSSSSGFQIRWFSVEPDELPEE
jgi:hypothetical protein